MITIKKNKKNSRSEIKKRKNKVLKNNIGGFAKEKINK
jgi:hypothetical protein